ncbi:hypothetical protein [Novosphingobium sp.]|uniref:hypothetical protein n=1 Tax=Novosphingobium sp. TaxID=1874826 RepID=UPI001D4FFE22|nr:hypothetical protein [Novosphingobium sp.]MBX9661898.1 hypothetical protein [Novosphingobium sp.]
MSRERLSPAERWRQHRAAFTLALELRCTPAEAAQELARREARARWEASNARLQAKMNGRPCQPPPPPPPAPEGQPPPPWMLFD